MDYYSLKRRDLQDLCKKHNLPANVTNLKMADSLAALLKVPEKVEIAASTCSKDSVGCNGGVAADTNVVKKVKFIEQEKPEKPASELTNQPQRTFEPEFHPRARRKALSVLQKFSINDDESREIEVQEKPATFRRRTRAPPLPESADEKKSKKVMFLEQEKPEKAASESTNKLDKSTGTERGTKTRRKSLAVLHKFSTDDQEIGEMEVQENPVTCRRRTRFFSRNHVDTRAAALPESADQKQAKKVTFLEQENSEKVASELTDELENTMEPKHGPRTKRMSLSFVQNFSKNDKEIGEMEVQENPVTFRRTRSCARNVVNARAVSVLKSADEKEAMKVTFHDQEKLEKMASELSNNPQKTTDPKLGPRTRRKSLSSMQKFCTNDQEIGKMEVRENPATFRRRTRSSARNDVDAGATSVLESALEREVKKQTRKSKRKNKVSKEIRDAHSPLPTTDILSSTSEKDRSEADKAAAAEKMKGAELPASRSLRSQKVLLLENEVSFQEVEKQNKVDQKAKLRQVVRKTAEKTEDEVESDEKMRLTEPHVQTRSKNTRRKSSTEFTEKEQILPARPSRNSRRQAKVNDPFSFSEIEGCNIQTSNVLQKDENARLEQTNLGDETFRRSESAKSKKRRVKSRKDLARLDNQSSSECAGDVEDNADKAVAAEHAELHGFTSEEAIVESDLDISHLQTDEQIQQKGSESKRAVCAAEPDQEKMEMIEEDDAVGYIPANCDPQCIERNSSLNAVHLKVLIEDAESRFDDVQGMHQVMDIQHLHALNASEELMPAKRDHELIDHCLEGQRVDVDIEEVEFNCYEKDGGSPLIQSDCAFTHPTANTHCETDVLASPHLDEIYDEASEEDVDVMALEVVADHNEFPNKYNDLFIQGKKDPELIFYCPEGECVGVDTEEAKFNSYGNEEGSPLNQSDSAFINPTANNCCETDVPACPHLDQNCDEPSKEPCFTVISKTNKEFLPESFVADEIALDCGSSCSTLNTPIEEHIELCKTASRLPNEGTSSSSYLCKTPVSPYGGQNELGKSMPTVIGTIVSARVDCDTETGNDTKYSSEIVSENVEEERTSPRTSVEDTAYHGHRKDGVKEASVINAQNTSEVFVSERGYSSSIITTMIKNGPFKTRFGHMKQATVSPMKENYLFENNKEEHDGTMDFSHCAVSPMGTHISSTEGSHGSESNLITPEVSCLEKQEEAKCLIKGLPCRVAETQMCQEIVFLENQTCHETDIGPFGVNDLVQGISADSRPAEFDMHHLSVPVSDSIEDVTTSFVNDVNEEFPSRNSSTCEAHALGDNDEIKAYDYFDMSCDEQLADKEFNEDNLRKALGYVNHAEEMNSMDETFQLYQEVLESVSDAQIIHDLNYQVYDRELSFHSGVRTTYLDKEADGSDIQEADSPQCPSQKYEVQQDAAADNGCISMNIFKCRKREHENCQEAKSFGEFLSQEIVSQERVSLTTQDGVLLEAEDNTENITEEKVTLDKDDCRPGMTIFHESALEVIQDNNLISNILITEEGDAEVPIVGEYKEENNDTITVKGICGYVSLAQANKECMKMIDDQNSLQKLDLHTDEKPDKVETTQTSPETSGLDVHGIQYDKVLLDEDQVHSVNIPAKFNLDQTEYFPVMSVVHEYVPETNEYENAVSESTISEEEGDEGVPNVGQCSEKVSGDNDSVINAREYIPQAQECNECIGIVDSDQNALQRHDLDGGKKSEEVQTQTSSEASGAYAHEIENVEANQFAVEDNNQMDHIDIEDQTISEALGLDEGHTIADVNEVNHFVVEENNHADPVIAKDKNETLMREMDESIPDTIEDSNSISKTRVTDEKRGLKVITGGKCNQEDSGDIILVEGDHEYVSQNRKCKERMEMIDGCQNSGQKLNNAEETLKVETAQGQVSLEASGLDHAIETNNQVKEFTAEAEEHGDIAPSVTEDKNVSARSTSVNLIPEDATEIPQESNDESHNQYVDGCMDIIEIDPPGSVGDNSWQKAVQLDGTIVDTAIVDEEAAADLSDDTRNIGAAYQDFDPEVKGKRDPFEMEVTDHAHSEDEEIKPADSEENEDSDQCIVLFELSEELDAVPVELSTNSTETRSEIDENKEPVEMESTDRARPKEVDIEPADREENEGSDQCITVSELFEDLDAVLTESSTNSTETPAEIDEICNLMMVSLQITSPVRVDSPDLAEDASSPMRSACSKGSSDGKPASAAVKVAEKTAAGAESAVTPARWKREEEGKENTLCLTMGTKSRVKGKEATTKQGKGARRALQSISTINSDAFHGRRDFVL